DLAVQDDLHCAVLVCHRLVPPAQVDNAETAETKADILAEKIPTVVRPAVIQHLRHAGEELRLDRLSVQMRQTSEAAHGLSAPPGIGGLAQRVAATVVHSYGC